MCIAPYFYINVYVLEKVYSCFMSGISLIQVFLALLSGGIVGFSLGLIGGGGSILAVPLLIYLVGYSDPHGAIGTTALAVGINALLNIVPHALKRHVNFRLGVIFSSTGVMGVYLGSELGLMTEGRRLLFLFSLLMIIVAINMLRSKKENSSKGIQVAKNSFLKLAGAGLGVGFLSGFFGIGGGFFNCSRIDHIFYHRYCAGHWNLPDSCFFFWFSNSNKILHQGLREYHFCTSLCDRRNHWRVGRHIFHV